MIERDTDRGSIDPKIARLIGYGVATVGISIGMGTVGHAMSTAVEAEPNLAGKTSVEKVVKGDQVKILPVEDLKLSGINVRSTPGRASGSDSRDNIVIPAENVTSIDISNPLVRTPAP